MRRDFLKELGIEDKDIINKILDENSKDIGKAKGDTDDLETEISKLKVDLGKMTDDYNTLKEKTKDYEDLKGQINQLELDKAQLNTDNAQLKVDLNNKVTQILKNHAIENAARDAKAKNIKAVMALLDMEKITYENNELKGASEQFDALKSGEDTSFLFGETQGGAPVGTHITTPNTNGGGKTPPVGNFAAAVAKAIGTN